MVALDHAWVVRAGRDQTSPLQRFTNGGAAGALTVEPAAATGLPQAGPRRIAPLIGRESDEKVGRTFAKFRFDDP